MKLLSSFLLALTLFTPCFGQAKAVIKGPTEVIAGTLLFLSHEDAVGDTKVWVIPESLKTTSATCVSNIFFSIPTPGNYTFQLIVADKTAAIDYAFHNVKVIPNGVVVPDPKPPTNPPPVVPAPTDFKALRQASINGLKVLQDWTVTNSLRTTLQSTLVVTQNSNYEQTAQLVQQNVGIVFGSRTPEQYKMDWFLLWRVPVNKELALIPKERYREAIIALTETLCKDCIQ